jgi:hypothetical protein
MCFVNKVNYVFLIEPPLTYYTIRIALQKLLSEKSYFEINSTNGCTKAISKLSSPIKVEEFQLMQSVDAIPSHWFISNHEENNECSVTPEVNDACFTFIRRCVDLFLENNSSDIQSHVSKKILCTTDAQSLVSHYSDFMDNNLNSEIVVSDVLKILNSMAQMSPSLNTTESEEVTYKDREIVQEQEKEKDEERELEVFQVINIAVMFIRRLMYYFKGDSSRRKSNRQLFECLESL